MVLRNNAKWWIKVYAATENGSLKHVLLEWAFSQEVPPVHNCGNIASCADDNAKTFIVQMKKLVVGFH
jgi:hypothetical protein